MKRKILTSLLVLSLLLTLTSTLLLSVSAIPTVGTNVNVTAHSANQNEPMVAINPTDPTKLVCGYNDNRLGLFRTSWSWSDDGGSTWNYGGTFSFAGYDSGADPVVAFDSTGTAYFAGLTYNNDPVTGRGVDGSIFIAKSNDGGHTFNVWQKIIATGSGYDTLDKPWLFINPANNDIYLAWVKRLNAWAELRGDPNPEYMTIWFTRSTDGGTTFSTPIKISTFSNPSGTDRSHGPQITAVSGSHVYVSWHTIEAGPGGSPLPPPTFPWRIWITESTDGGASFGTNYLVATTVWGYPSIFISMDADPSSGRVYIAYADSLVMSPRNYDIFVTTSTSAAGPWTTPVRVNDNPAGWQTWPALDVAPNGRVDVIWYDDRDDLTTGKNHVYYSASTDGGATWETNTKITDVNWDWPAWPVFAGDYSTIASLNDKAQAVWMDNRLGTPEIYTTTLTMALPPDGDEHDVAAVAQTVTENEVLPGTMVDIDVTVTNLGQFTETFDVTCYYDSVEIGTILVLDLAPGETRVVTFTWDTTGVPFNEYKIKAWADSGEAITEVNEDNNWCKMELPMFIIPEVPLGTVVTVLSMFIAFVGFVGFKRFRRK